ncbi:MULTISPECIES: H-NS family histone-like protein [Alkalimonas]|uniref:H-NS histone family protein n=1 Tax=Alkalimonas mucilaginosa TaxID=3057676 RepID=A0ABU7JIW1_9GAMM|nr:H-NS histone family protein [Alkalimonas sp. MEB004]MEE2025629.1 H-NS histone family protein [Alkalimonas sp. MEB004]
MSLLLNKKELKKAAEELSVVKLQDVIRQLNDVLENRKRETEALEELKDFVKQKGFTFQQLGISVQHEVVSVDEPQAVTSKRPVKPKLKSLNKEKQYFYVDEGKLQLLKTHTMKQGLRDRGISILSYADVSQKHQKDVDALLAEAEQQAIENFNAKVGVWNQWAEANGAEMLSPK